MRRWPPIRVSDLDSDGDLMATLGMTEGEVWLLRPDAHIAAIQVRPSPDDVRLAVARCLGRTSDAELVGGGAA